MFYQDPFRGIKEKDIQELLFRHPYLIDTRFENYIPLQFYQLPSGFADIVIFLNNTVIVIELKIEHLKKTHVLQVAQYAREIQERFPSKMVEAILIGRSPRDDLTNLMTTFSFHIEIKNLKDDVPIKMKICLNCRCGNGISRKSCWKCGKKKWLDQ